MTYKRSLIIFFCFLATFVQGCNLPTSIVTPPPAMAAPTDEKAATQGVELPTDTAAPETPTATPAPVTATLEPTPTTAVVTLTASSGNLKIRRGPGLAYNTLDVFAQGRSITPLGRNEDGNWVYIAMPSNTSKFGWISTQTPYTTITGDVMSLPVQAADPAQPAYLRNCTYHPMLVMPGEAVVPPRTDSPNNKVQLNPGSYTVYDTSMASKPQVLSVDLQEGDSVDIKTDAIPNTYSCP